MKIKKTWLVILLIVLFLAGLLGYFYLVNLKPNNSVIKTVKSTQETVEKNYLLVNYPVETVPLYELKKVSSSKFYVNDDPNNFADYFGQPVNYYNVVFETKATPTALLAYYRSLMSEVNEDAVSTERIEGKIGKYKVSASHYGENPQNYAYLQVYLPAEEYQKINPYYQDYPNIVEIDSSLPEYETAYGLLNQKGGEIEFWQYFSLPKDESKIDELIKTYQEKYQLETGYSFDEKSGLMKWQSGNYAINLTISKAHGRVYLMVRQPM
jgi:hypothetical protein